MSEIGQAEFTTLWLEHLPALRADIARYFSKVEDREDAEQSIALAAWQAYKPGQFPAESFSKFLEKVAQLTVLPRLARKRKRIEQHELPIADVANVPL